MLATASDDQVREYLNSLREGERVIETGQSCMTGRKGTVYIKDKYPCVLWDKLPGDTGQMGTSATWGTRRVSDTVKKPNIESAAVVARVISRLLKKAGFTMADTSDKYRWTEGFHVHRLGYSNTVIVDYNFKTLNHEQHRAKIREERLKAHNFLSERGYEFDPKYPGLLYINCERD